MQAIPTIYFPGLCADALSFYRDILHAEVLFQLTAIPDAQPQYLAPGSPGKIIRAGLRIGATVVYLSEGHHAGAPAFQGFSLNLHVDSNIDAARILQALGEGGDVRIPLRATAWADGFGAVVDRYGVHWMIEFAGTRAPQ
ncbi:VOC family protein [Massilia putida]|uniref:VOC family protein n=1 Tax=Massilia putida TaxID=1141883 RepID=UPI000953323C|nr:VOC family protein [Massilia putida]